MLPTMAIFMLSRLSRLRAPMHWNDLRCDQDLQCSFRLLLVCLGCSLARSDWCSAHADSCRDVCDGAGCTQVGASAGYSGQRQAELQCSSICRYARCAPVNPSIFQPLLWTHSVGWLSREGLQSLANCEGCRSSSLTANNSASSKPPAVCLKKPWRKGERRGWPVFRQTSMISGRHALYWSLCPCRDVAQQCPSHGLDNIPGMSQPLPQQMLQHH